MDHNAQPAPQGLQGTIDIGFLQPQAAEFYKTPGGFLALRYEGRAYPRVSLRRALPIGRPMDYISVADSENKEIAIIQSIGQLSGAQAAIVQDELDRRYYCPQVYEIKSVKDKMGYVYMELIIGNAAGRFDKNCAIKDVNKNIRMLDDDRLLLFDVDGNRYIVQSLAALDKKSYKRLEPYLF